METLKAEKANLRSDLDKHAVRQQYLQSAIARSAESKYSMRCISVAFLNWKHLALITLREAQQSLEATASATRIQAALRGSTTRARLLSKQREGQQGQEVRRELFVKSLDDGSPRTKNAERFVSDEWSFVRIVASFSFGETEPSPISAPAEDSMLSSQSFAVSTFHTVLSA